MSINTTHSHREYILKFQFISYILTLYIHIFYILTDLNVEESFMNKFSIYSIYDQFFHVIWDDPQSFPKRIVSQYYYVSHKIITRLVQHISRCMILYVLRLKIIIFNVKN